MFLNLSSTNPFLWKQWFARVQRISAHSVPIFWGALNKCSGYRWRWAKKFIVRLLVVALSPSIFDFKYGDLFICIFSCFPTFTHLLPIELLSYLTWGVFNIFFYLESTVYVTDKLSIMYIYIFCCHTVLYLCLYTVCIPGYLYVLADCTVQTYTMSLVSRYSDFNYDLLCQ